jgi:hypothetical protein
MAQRVAMSIALCGAAWHEHDEDARRALLVRVWADAVYCDPTVRQGRETLVAHMAGFQKGRPGDRLELATGIEEHHHGWLRFGWRLVAADGTAAFEGMDVGKRDPDGRLARIVGFFGPCPPLPT